MVAGRCAPGNGQLPLSLPSRWDLGAQRPATQRSTRRAPLITGASAVIRVRRASAAH